jgi:hypothetical protein
MAEFACPLTVREVGEFVPSPVARREWLGELPVIPL